MATCPCGSGVPDGACCGPLLGGVPAPTALALMRSRYTAYVRGAVDYLIETDDATTRGAMDRAEPRRYSAALPVGGAGQRLGATKATSLTSRRGFVGVVTVAGRERSITMGSRTARGERHQTISSAR